MRIAPQVMEALVQVISGGPGGSDVRPIGIYRSASRIEGFLRACGAEATIQGSRLPALHAALEQVLERVDAEKVLIGIIEAAADPSDFRDAEHHQKVVAYLNARLQTNGLVLR